MEELRHKKKGGTALPCRLSSCSEVSQMAIVLERGVKNLVPCADRFLSLNWNYEKVCRSNVLHRKLFLIPGVNNNLDNPHKIVGLVTIQDYTYIIIKVKTE